MARQWFSGGEILAFLPLAGAGGNSVAVVWSVHEARTAELVAFAKTLPGLHVSVLVPNLRGAEAAIASGAHGMVLPLSASHAHSLANLRKTPDAVLDDDPEKAKRLLDAAGCTAADGGGTRKSKDGAPLRFRIMAIADTAVDVKAAELFVTAAKDVGIELDLSTTDADTMGAAVFNAEAPDWDIMVWGWDSSFYDPSYLLGIPTKDQIGGNNDTFWVDPRYDELYAQQSTTLDRSARVKLVQEMQAIHYAACPYIVMWYQKKLSGVRTTTWTGWQPITGGMILNFPRVNYLDVKPV